MPLLPFHEMPMVKCIGQNILFDGEHILEEEEVDNRTAAVVVPTNLLEDHHDSLLAVENDDSLHQTILLGQQTLEEVFPVLHRSTEDSSLVEAEEQDTVYLVLSIHGAVEAVLVDMDESVSKSLVHGDYEDLKAGHVVLEMQIQDLHSLALAAMVVVVLAVVVLVLLVLDFRQPPWPIKTKHPAFEVNQEQSKSRRLLVESAAAEVQQDTFWYFVYQETEDNILMVDIE